MTTKIIQPENLSTDFKIDSDDRKIKVNIKGGSGVDVIKNDEGITVQGTSNRFERVFKGVLRKDHGIDLPFSFKGKQFFVLCMVYEGDEYARSGSIQYVTDNPSTSYIFKLTSGAATAEVRFSNNWQRLNYFWNSEPQIIISEIWVLK